jgi:cytochrome oxidase assembly protein ShyY1
MLARSPGSTVPQRSTVLVVTAAAIAFTIVTVLLGNWQTRRAEGREAAFAAVADANRTVALDLDDPTHQDASVVGRRITAHGEFAGAATIFLDNRQREGQPGVEVLTPLRLANGRAAMVDRGFMPIRAQERNAISAPPLPAGPVTVEGLAIERLSRSLELGHVAHALGGVWSNFSAEEFSQVSGIELLPFVVEQSNDLSDGLSREWPSPGAGSQQNRSYALQWYSMAALAIAAWLWFMLASVIRKRSRTRVS